MGSPFDWHDGQLYLATNFALEPAEDPPDFIPPLEGLLHYHRPQACCCSSAL